MILTSIARLEKSWAMTVTASVAALASSLIEAKPLEAQKGKTAIVVPFGIEGVDDASTAADLTEVTTETLAKMGATVERAKAPLVDILTLIECPAMADKCIASLAEVLATQTVVVGRVSSERVEIVMVERDRTFKRITHLVGSGDSNVVKARYRRALRTTLGMPVPTASGPAPDGSLSGPTTTGLSEPAGRQSDSSTASSATASNLSRGPMTDPGPLERNTVVQTSRSDRRAGLKGVRPLSWGVLAGGIVGLGVGGIFYAQALSTQDEVALAPARTPEDIAAIRELEDRGDTQKTTAAVFTTIGAVAAIGGLGMILWDAAGPADTSVSVAGLVTADGGSVSISGSF